MFTRLLSLLLLLSVPALANEKAIEPEPIAYQVTKATGFSHGTIDGKTAYLDWRRGSFDKEVMFEVTPQDLPSKLPPATVIPFTAPTVAKIVDPRDRKRPLKGEDKIFVQINKDEKKARCFLLGQGCAELVEPEQKDSLYKSPLFK